MRPSLRLKAALGFAAATLALLAVQAAGMRHWAADLEGRLLGALVTGDMHSALHWYQADPAALPPFNPQAGAHLVQEPGPDSGAAAKVALPETLRGLPPGIHEVPSVDGGALHVAVGKLGTERVIRVYDFRQYEDGLGALWQRAALAIAALVLAAGLLGYWCVGLVGRQVRDLGRQVAALRTGSTRRIAPGSAAEPEVIELAATVEAYHHRMQAMVERERAFTGNVSHELRTPLTAILTTCELLEIDKSLGPAARQRVEKIERAARHMHALTHTLLSLAREDGPRAATAIALRGAVNEVLDLHADTLQRRQLLAHVEVAPEARVLADPSDLHIVLSNLLDNAVRHASHSRIDVMLEGDELRIRDQGCGIDPAALPYLFERHYRGAAEDGQGAGIGLHIVKQICDRNRWEVRVDSEVGVGTCVRLRMPVHRS
ncbi:HAMP domain-containing histidine kinase [Massilia arenosa]|uniref:histidine kinase n=1 Tax=Zemynaea arenosa TaxID=2561931 RepID=A0A4Y9SET9_9BURK|nr:HAMP domain-containing sensor histidine kinase [Massilia arenosa]TFW21767.1 HAMP domain-containing histidine kinase [Massilia arenosa]